MDWREEPSTDPGARHRRDGTPDGSIEFRQGLMMREMAELRARVDHLERRFFKASMRPQVKTAGLTTAVAGAVVGALELLRYLEIFR